MASEEILEKKSEGFAPLSARVDVSRLKKDIFLLRKTLAVCAAGQRKIARCLIRTVFTL